MFLADATLYLEILRHHRHCLAVAASGHRSEESAGRRSVGPDDVNFYNGKIITCRYFFGYELPKIEGLAIRLLNGDGLTVAMKNEYFEE